MLRSPTTKAVSPIWTNLPAILGYMTCSALMLIANKLAVNSIPAPAFVLFCQLAGCAGVVAVASFLGYADVDKLEWGKIKRFAIVPLAFLCTVYANIKILQHANVETFITFRASTPLLVSIADYIFLGRELPTPRSWVCLIVLLLGAACYALTDSNFSVDAYHWVAVWLAIFCFDQIYIKHVVRTVKMTTWGRVMYSNLIGAIPMFGIFLVTGEAKTVTTMQWTFSSTLWLTISVLIGCSIAYFSFLARAAVSATSFTVLGNTCKVRCGFLMSLDFSNEEVLVLGWVNSNLPCLPCLFRAVQVLTVTINVMMWSNHASPTGLACLFVCLVAAYFYQQAPLRSAATRANATSVV